MLGLQVAAHAAIGGIIIATLGVILTAFSDSLGEELVVLGYVITGLSFLLAISVT